MQYGLLPLGGAEDIPDKCSASVSSQSSVTLAPPVVTLPASSAEGLMIQPLISMHHVTVDGPVTAPSMDHAPWLLSQEDWLD